MDKKISVTSKGIVVYLFNFIMSIYIKSLSSKAKYQLNLGIKSYEDIVIKINVIKNDIQEISYNIQSIIKRIKEAESNIKGLSKIQKDMK